MAKIILNNEEFTFSSYSRSTSFDGENIYSNGYVGGLSGENIVTRLEELAQDPITSITIKKDNNEEIYNLSDINANINNIEENYNGVDAINTNVNLHFNQ